jgi:hypothetical protein
MKRIFVSHEQYEAIVNNQDGLIVETSGEPGLIIKSRDFSAIATSDHAKKELAKVRYMTETGPKYFFTSGTGLPCKVAIDYFKDCGDVIVVDRKDRKWKKGELLKETTDDSRE